ncbi:MAG: acetyl-CoA carboxylase biotin carboxylase subunit, partial [Candidatus Sulfotelmatobacter sp.]
LFRRILCDPDFRAAKLDTGFLDRMLKRSEHKDVDARAAEVAAIAAGMFAALGAGAESASPTDLRPASPTLSNWKNASRKEALG